MVLLYMDNFKASKRSTQSSGQVKRLRADGFIPAILYGGSKKNLSLRVKKNILKDVIKTESFMSKVVNLDIEG